MISRFKKAVLALVVVPCLALSGQALAASSIQLPVPRGIIQAGQTVSDRDLIERKFPVQTARQFAVVPHRQNVVGMVARRALMPGQPIPITAVEPLEIVKRGEMGRLIFRENGLFILMQVEVLQSGGLGETVRVRNVDSGVVVSGRVRSDGAIEVGN